MTYKETIKKRILEEGNSYGEKINIKDDKKTHKTILHRGCTARLREKELINSVTKALKTKNIEFTTLTDETCCGIMLFILKDKETGEKIVKENIKKYKKHGVEKIITICPGCYESFTDHYTPKKDFNIEVIFAMDLFNNEKLDGTGHIIHDPCHALERKTQIRDIIQNIPEKRANSCCGFGISIKTGKKELKEKIAKETLKGDTVITYCPSCYHTLNTVNPEKTKDFFTLYNEQKGT